MCTFELFLTTNYCKHVIPNSIFNASIIILSNTKYSYLRSTVVVSYWQNMEMKAISFPPYLSDAQEIERAASTCQCLPQRYYRAGGRYHTVYAHYIKDPVDTVTTLWYSAREQVIETVGREQVEKGRWMSVHNDFSSSVCDIVSTFVFVTVL